MDVFATELSMRVRNQRLDELGSLIQLVNQNAHLKMGMQRVSENDDGSDIGELDMSITLDFASTLDLAEACILLGIAQSLTTGEDTESFLDRVKDRIDTLVPVYAEAASRSTKGD